MTRPRAWLIVTAGPHAGEIVVVADEPVILGRTGLLRKEVRSTRKQAKVEHTGDGWVVVDLNGIGTIFHGEELRSETRPLRHGDVITIGGSTIELSEHEPSTIAVVQRIDGERGTWLEVNGFGRAVFPVFSAAHLTWATGLRLKPGMHLIEKRAGEDFLPATLDAWSGGVIVEDIDGVRFSELEAATQQEARVDAQLVVEVLLRELQLVHRARRWQAIVTFVGRVVLLAEAPPGPRHDVEAELSRVRAALAACGVSPGGATSRKELLEVAREAWAGLGGTPEPLMLRGMLAHLFPDRVAERERVREEAAVLGADGLLARVPRR